MAHVVGFGGKYWIIPWNNVEKYSQTMPSMQRLYFWFLSAKRKTKWSEIVQTLSLYHHAMSGDVMERRQVFLVHDHFHVVVLCLGSNQTLNNVEHFYKTI